MTDCSTESNNTQNYLVKTKETSLSLIDTNQSSNSTSVSSDLSRLNDTNHSNENAQASAKSSSIPHSSSQACLADVATSMQSNTKFNLEEFIKQQLQTNLKDRYFMLQTEKCLTDLIKDEKNNTYAFPSMNPYYRMFVHRISEYFGLGHNLDQAKQCVIVNKTNTTKLPTNSFMAIIKSAEASASTDQSTLASPNSPSSPALDSNQEDSSIQNTQKKILKREVNANNKDFPNMKKPAEPMKMKTFEEKSAEYIRIKNRIFNVPENDDNSTTSNTNQQFKILTNQQKTEQIKQQNNKQIKPGKNKNNNNNKNKNRPANLHSVNGTVTTNGINGNNSESFPINYPNHHVSAPTYQMQPQTDNYFNSNQQAFKMNNHQIPLLNDPYKFMYTNQHQVQSQQHQQHVKFNQLQQNAANISSSKQQTYSSHSYNQNTMSHHQSHPPPPHPSQIPPPPQMIHSNNLPYHHYSQMPLHPPPPLQAPAHTAPPQMHIHPAQLPPAQFYTMNSQSNSTATSTTNNISNNFNSQQQQQQQQNVAYYQPSYSREQLSIVDPNNSQQFYNKQHQYSSQSQMYLNAIQYHQVSNMNSYHAAIAQSSEYASQPTNMTLQSAQPPQLTTSVVSMPSNTMNPPQNLTLSSSSSSSLQQPASMRSVRADFYPSSHLDEKQHVNNNNHTNVPYFNNNSSSFKHNAVQSNDSSLKQSASFSSLPMNNYPFHNNMVYANNKLNINYADNKSTNNRKIKNSNKHYISNTRGYNHSNSGLNLNKYQKATSTNVNLTVSNNNNNKNTQEASSCASAELNEKQADSTSAINNSTDQCISFQVYNLKQNLTKQMLNDLLKPYVVSIDFKPTNASANSANTTPANDHSIINEENENVFIKFENIDKLREAFKSFNLNEKDLVNDSSLVVSASNEHSINNSDNLTSLSNDNNNNNDNSSTTTTEHIKEQHDTPFLLKQIIIC